MSPLFSIVIPAFNRCEPLKYTLRSAAQAAAQLPPGAVDIIVVDDGSNPPLSAQLAGFSSGHEVRFVPQPNQGSIIARLTGLQVARGERVLFLDSDDLIHRDKLRRHLEIAESTEAEVTYDDMAIATLSSDYSASYTSGSRLPTVENSIALFLQTQPLPHNPVYRCSYVVRALRQPLVPPQRRMDASGDVWLYHNLSVFPAKVAKVDVALTAVGPHEEVRFSQHWEKLGWAALLIAETFMRNCPRDEATRLARQTVGEAAFRSWRRLPYDYRASYGERLLKIWQQAPRGPLSALGGGVFCILARLVGPVLAGRWHRRWCGHSYASCRTLNEAQLARLFDDSLV